MVLRSLACALAAGLTVDGVAHAQAVDPTRARGDLADLSLEELAAIEVTSVSRRPEPLSQAAAAVFVISSEDIRRSGATSLPEVLRLAPNLDVQRVNAGDYAISARGFNGFETSNKLLVLIDGRSVYSSLSSGVFWDMVDVPLENVDRIEVISGPGGVLYGANAVNGVINIVTQAAGDATGGLVAVAAGTEDATATARIGGALGSAGTWRLTANAFRRDDSLREDGSDATDSTEGSRINARADWRAGSSAFTLEAEMFDHEVTVNEDFTRTPAPITGGHVRGAWARPLWGGDLQAQAYYDENERTDSGAVERIATWDALVQYAVDLGRHRLVVGGGHRSIDAAFDAPATAVAFLDPPDRKIRLSNVFVQDQVILTPGLTLTLGAKFEDNSFSGEELLPNARLAWERSGGDLLWIAVSRASRTPNRIERDLMLPGFLEPTDFQSERLTAYEVGYRASPAPWLSVSLSAFHNEYDHLRTVSPDPATFLPLGFSNLGGGRTRGVEGWGAAQVAPWWRLSAGFATLDKDLVADPARDITGLISQGDDPDSHGFVSSRMDLGEALELDVSVRATGDLAETPGYVAADVRLGWRISDRLQAWVAGRDLFDDVRFETGDPARRRAFEPSLTVGLRAGF